MSTISVSEGKDHPLRSSWGGWPLERVLFALAGAMTGLSALLSAFVSDCGASVVFRFFGLRSGCGR